MKFNYNKLYDHLLTSNYPNITCQEIQQLTTKLNNSLEVIKLNEKLHKEEINKENQRLKSYDLESIQQILKYQKENDLNNTEVAKKFRISKNTITKWKKLYRADL